MSLIYKILETFVIQSFPKREGGAQNVAQTLKRPQNSWGYKGHTIEVRLLACDTTDILLYFSIRCKHNDGCSQFQGLQVFFLSIALLHFHFFVKLHKCQVSNKNSTAKRQGKQTWIFTICPFFLKKFPNLGPANPGWKVYIMETSKGGI